MQTRSLGTVGGNICNGTPSADLTIPLLAYGARIRVRSLAGERMIKLCDFFLAPRRTALRKGEIVTAIELFTPRSNCGAAFGKVGRRRAMRLAVVNAAACLKMEGGVVRDVRLAMGTVAPIPVRLYRTEEFLRGRELTPPLLEEATAMMAGEISPRSSVRASAEYRREIAGVLLKRILTGALIRALAGGK
jgi:carbon-monoxide dehydrogenase medium subunit